jgi:hypothetical protein
MLILKDAYARLPSSERRGIINTSEEQMKTYKVSCSTESSSKEIEKFNEKVVLLLHKEVDYRISR